MAHSIHGHSYNKSPTYHSWVAMKTRCFNKKHIAYKNYGGRGITVCKRWLEFKNFLEDMGERPEGTFLDRKKSNGNYEPGNCKWSTREEQNSNKRTTQFIMDNGELKALADFCRQYSLNIKVVHTRYKLGWSAEAIKNTPVAKRSPRKRVI